ncbi:hypothetical protein [Candidatus Aciduliprofundum boonei]|uniref:Uncharacterized protein n=1 Tax=Aciduliprofundum boonei (strain DSM 19572 / T469) TaxID=439481 RepID=B5IA02_ACIB4|nr:hypothetical protein [Candidatus Aciduliprofundum boonei]ADD08363.1 hypothetical protein Aboo_0552 [Aciduliprofundum boonei T469]EDY37120.1 hypothetical protein ABOONEI_2041 [Aciduliprofundum boonei T469]HII55721.1 hypothetical protein [Candidatus Aciduliprofundum boonei]
MKVVVGIVAILALILLIPAVHSSQPSQGWGYKWNFKNGEIENASFVGRMSGNRVMGLYIEPAIYENGIYNMSYKGSYYAYGFMNGVWKGKNATVYGEYHNSTIQLYWVNWDGYILMKKVNMEINGKNYSFYGVVKQYIHLYTPEPRDEYLNVSSFIPKPFQMWDNSTSEIKATYDMKMFISYNSSLPYILNEDGNLSYYMKAKYWGDVRASINGYATARVSVKWINNTVTIHRDLTGNFNKEFKGIINFKAHIFRHGNYVQRVDILENIPFSFAGIPYLPYKKANSSEELGWWLRGSLLDLIAFNNDAKLENGFYTQITLNRLFVRYTSEPAKEVEIDSMMKEAPQLYGEYRMQSVAIYASTIVAVSIIVTILAVSFSKRKN